MNYQSIIQYYNTKCTSNQIIIPYTGTVKYVTTQIWIVL